MASHGGGHGQAVHRGGAAVPANWRQYDQKRRVGEQWWLTSDTSVVSVGVEEVRAVLATWELTSVGVPALAPPRHVISGEVSGQTKESIGTRTSREANLYKELN